MPLEAVLIGTRVFDLGGFTEKSSTVLKTATTLAVTPTPGDLSALNGGIIAAIAIAVVVVTSLVLLLLIMVGVVIRRRNLKSEPDKVSR